MTPPSPRRADLERLAAVLAHRHDPVGADERARLVDLLHSVAAGIADPADPQVREIVDGLDALDGSPLGDASFREVAERVDPADVAAVLDRVAAHDQGTRPLDLPHEDPPGGGGNGALGAWRREVGQLLRGNPVSDVELATELRRRGVRAAPQVVLDAQADARLVQITVELLGGEWEEDSYRALYEAARREQEPDTLDVAERRKVSGLAGAEAVDVVAAGVLLRAPVQDLPRYLPRHALITRIVEGLDEPKRLAHVLVGEAGYGKSTVALAAARRAQELQVVPLWIPAPDEDALLDGLCQAAIWAGATVVGINAALRAEGDQRIERLWHLLDESPHRWLLVLDDAGPRAVGHAGWLHRSETGTTVITTRHGDPESWGPDAEVLPVGVLGDEDGARLLLDRISLAGSRMAAGAEGYARRLSRLLAGMPLALTSVGSLVADRAGAEALGELVERLQPSTTPPVAATYSLCLQSVALDDQASARHLLRLLASFAPDEPLPVHILAGAPETEWHGRDGLGELIRIGLLDEPPHRPELRLIRLHPAVAEQSRDDPVFDRAAAGRIDLRAISLLVAELVRLDPGAPTAWLRIRRLEPHVAEVVESPALVTVELQAAALSLAERAAAALVCAGSHPAATTLLDWALERLALVGADHPVRLAARHTHAWMLTRDGNGDLPAAEAALKEVLADRLRVLGEDDPGTLTTADAYAWVIAEQGRLDSAEVRFEHVLRLRSQLLGPDHPDTLTTRHRLAWVTALQSREAEAVAEFTRVLDQRRSRLGSDHLDVFATRYRLAWALNRLGQHTEAERRYRDLRRDLEAVVGDQHPLTLMARSRHAWTLASLDRFRDAEKVYRRLRLDQRRVLGEGHPRLIATRQALAWIDLLQGRVAAAVPEFRAVADRRREILGADHPRTLDSRSWLAWAQLKSGRAAAAVRGFEAVLADRRRVLGERHPTTLLTRHLLSRALMRRGRLPEAERQLRGLLDEEHGLALDHRNMLHARHTLAHVIGLRGRFTESEQALRAVLADRTALLGADHRETMVTRDQLSWVLGRGGRIEQGAAVCRALLADRLRVLAPAHPHTLASRYREAWFEELLERPDSSRRLLEDLLPDLQHGLGDDHPDTLRCRAALVRIERLHGDLVVAARTAELLVADEQRIQGPDAVDTLRAREELALILLAQGHAVAGRDVLETVLADQRRVLPDDHPDLVRVCRRVMT